MARQRIATPAQYLDPVTALVGLIRMCAETTSAVVALLRATPKDKIAVVFAGYSEKALARMAKMAERWGTDETAAIAWVHQTFPPAVYPANGPEAADYPILANLPTLYNALREQGAIAQDAPGWVDVCKLAVERGVVEQDKAGFMSQGKWRPGYKLAVKADIEKIRAKLKARREAEKATGKVESDLPNLRNLLGM